MAAQPDSQLPYIWARDCRELRPLARPQRTSRRRPTTTTGTAVDPRPVVMQPARRPCASPFTLTPAVAAAVVRLPGRLALLVGGVTVRFRSEKHPEVPCRHPDANDDERERDGNATGLRPERPQQIKHQQARELQQDDAEQAEPAEQARRERAGFAPATRSEPNQRGDEITKPVACKRDKPPCTLVSCKPANSSIEPVSHGADSDEQQCAAANGECKCHCRKQQKVDGRRDERAVIGRRGHIQSITVRYKARRLESNREPAGIDTLLAGSVVAAGRHERVTVLVDRIARREIDAGTVFRELCLE